MVDFMPSRPHKAPAFEPRYRAGLFLSYHFHSGGIWSGDYYVAEYETLRTNPEAEPKSVRVHRIPEVLPVGRLTDLVFPFAEYRMRQRVADIGLGEDEEVAAIFAPEDEEIPPEESGIPCTLR